jgi:hypothetical protein
MIERELVALPVTSMTWRTYSVIEHTLHGGHLCCPGFFGNDAIALSAVKV